MIGCSQAQDFEPFGRGHLGSHPGKIQLQIKKLSGQDHGIPLVRAMRSVSIQDTSKKESWLRRKQMCGINTGSWEEELYVKENTVVWSQGGDGESRRVIKTFTVDTPVQQALWCNFILPDTLNIGEINGTSLDMPGQVESGVCVIESSCASVFTAEGKEYVTALPFQVSKVWNIKNGLLLERLVSDVEMTSPKRGVQPLPVLFSLLHPLDELAPVISKVGGNTACPKVAYVTDHAQEVVFSCDQPSLVMMYDTVIGTHSLWGVRRANIQEGYRAAGSQDTLNSVQVEAPATPIPGVSHSATYSSSQSRFTLSSQSPSMSPLRTSMSSRLYSPAVGSRSSPSLAQLAAISRSHSAQSPSMASSSLFRFQTPSPSSTRSPGGLSRTPIPHTSQSTLNETFVETAEPLMPEVCLDQIWVEGSTGSREGLQGKATKVFLSTDLCGQLYLCSLIGGKRQLRCLKIEESNDKTKLIFGTVSVILARDAVPLTSLNMILVLDSHCNLVLYTGTVKVNNIHVPGLPMTTLLMSHLGLRPTTPYDSPVTGGLVTSSRPSSALDTGFEDDVNLLSPVPSEIDQSSRISMLESSTADDASWQTTGIITALRDPVENKFTLELLSNNMVRTSLPEMSTSPVVKSCLSAIKHILPKDTAMSVLVKWYSTVHAPGSVSGLSEWFTFVRCLVTMMGYDTGKLDLTKQFELDGSMSPVAAAKKLRPSEQGSDEDWLHLITTSHHQAVSIEQGHFLGLKPIPTDPAAKIPAAQATIDSKAVLFHHIPVVMFALHLVYEDLKLNRLYSDELLSLATLLLQLARDLRCDSYMDLYCRDHVKLFGTEKQTSQVSEDDLKKMNYPSFLTKTPPSIHHWLYDFQRGRDPEPFPYLPDVTLNIQNVISFYAVLYNKDGATEPVWQKYLRKISASGHRASSTNVSLSKSFSASSTSAQTASENLVLFMVEMGFTKANIGAFPFGVALPLAHAVVRCKENPPSDWPEKAYYLIEREDLAKQVKNQKITIPTGANETINKKDEDDGMNYLDKELLKLRFSEDHRVQEVRRLLQSSKPVRIMLTQRPEVSDHDFIEEQARHLYAICIRTMGLPVGRGIFTLRTYHPVMTETLPIPKLCLTGRAPPRNNTIDLSHIETPPNMAAWPQFHNGVAAGLRIASSSQVDSTWITYNKPKGNDLTNEHAGFLMALGLNGHLNNLATMNVYDYLCRGHDMTSVGLLIGIAAAKRGTMDHSTVRLLSIHLAGLLPPTSTELVVPHIVQVAAILGVGLVYQGTAHSYIAEVLLGEIGRPPGPEMDNATDRESYSLASGLALGMVMLGRGSEAIRLSDFNMADQLYHYIVGGHKRPLSSANKERYKSPSYQIKEGDAVNIDVTSPGATLALGMMFFKTNNRAVADWLTAPDTQFLLEFVRPDFLMLRVISRGLVMWDYVCPSEKWVQQNIPEIVQMYAFNQRKYRDDPTCDVDFETMSQAYCNLIAGGCMAIALKFAGSANQEAFDCLLGYAKTFIKYLNTAKNIEQAGKSCLETCLVVIVLSVAMVMSGTGNLEVLRICRHLRGRVGPSYSYVLYGSHMCLSMAVSLLFMGGGRYTLSTSPEALVAMLCAFFPKFPNHSNDNRYHLQAFRHLYVLAAEPRLILPKNVDTGVTCYVPLEVHFEDTPAYKDQSYEAMAPCMLPELSQLKHVRVQGQRYWPVSFTASKNWDKLQNNLQNSGILYVKKRVGHLSYAKDPQGYRSLLVKALMNGSTGHRHIKPESIKAFSLDPRILAFTDYFCCAASDKEYDLVSVLSSLLHECISQEKPEFLQTCGELDKAIRNLVYIPDCQMLWQLKLVMAAFENAQEDSHQKQFISKEFLTSMKNRLEAMLDEWFKDSNKTLVSYLQNDASGISDAGLLSVFLAWYDVPSRDELMQILSTGVPSFPVLHSQLQPHHLSVGSLLRIHEMLNCAR